MIVCAASNNAGKLKELRRILEQMGHEVKSLRDLCIDLDPEETGTTFAENARIKAEAFCKASGLPTVADDSGLCVDALHGAPGVYSARYAGHHGDDAANNAKLLHEMADVPAGQRAALPHDCRPMPLAAGPMPRRSARSCSPTLTRVVLAPSKCGSGRWMTGRMFRLNACRPRARLLGRVSS